ncbi:MAG: hypothetical protein KTR31_17810 [Myxococcales bacterium]|nr:hypothetical protein [Myxococcales bacterium]
MPIVPWLLVGAANAADCDVTALTAAVREATPARTATRFAELAACDADAAASLAAKAIPKFLAGPDANEGVLAAIQIGENEGVRAWLAEQQPRELAPTIEWLGNQCSRAPEVEGFFVHAKDADNEGFFRDRWYRGLSDCRTEGVQALLGQALEDQASDRDRTRFYALVGLYARNLGEASVPKLVELMGTVPENERRLLVEAFADAGDVGNEEGMDAKAAKAAAAALLGAADLVPANSADVMRNTLASLGSEAEAEAAVRYRWPDRLTDGSYRYMALAHETWTCKNGKEYGTFHFGEVREPATRWPDTLAAEIRDLLDGPWKLGKAAKKCKGEAQIEVVIVDEPLAADTDTSDWLDAERNTFLERTAAFKKVSEAEEALLQL